MAGISRLSHRNEWPSHKRSLDGEVYNLHYKGAHHRWYLDNPTPDGMGTFFIKIDNLNQSCFNSVLTKDF